MVNLKKHAALREMLASKGSRIASILDAIHRMFPNMEAMRWYHFSRQLAELQRENEERRQALVAETHTMELPALPKPMRARLLLFGEKVEQAMIENKPARDTDPLATRKLSVEHFIETERRAAIKKVVLS